MIRMFVIRVRHELALRRLNREIERARRRLGLLPLGLADRKSLLRSVIEARSIHR